MTTALLFFVLCLSLSAVLIRLVISPSDSFTDRHASLDPAVLGANFQSQREAIVEAKLRSMLSSVIAPEDMRLLVHYRGLPAVPEIGSGAHQYVAQVVMLINRESVDPELQSLIRQLLLPVLGVSSDGEGAEDQGVLQLLARPFVDTPSQNGYLGFNKVEMILMALATFLSGLFSLMFWHSACGKSVRCSGVSGGSGGRLERAELAPDGLRALSQHEPRRIANVLSQWMEQDEP